VEDRQVPREELAELFWPHSPRARALQSLRQTLFKLRISLDRDLVEGDGLLRVAPDTLILDLDQFMDALARGDFEAASRLWRGPFLAGYRRRRARALTEWLENRRQHTERLYAEAVLRAATRRIEDERPDEALAILEGPLRSFPYRLDLQGLEVLALADMGRIGEAELRITAIDFPEGSSMEEELQDALHRARRRSPSPKGIPRPTEPAVPAPAHASASSSATSPATSSTSADPASQPRDRLHPRHPRLRVIAGWAAATLATLVVLGTLVRPPGSGGEVDGTLPTPTTVEGLAALQGDRSLLFCTDRATEGEGFQLFRMNYDGSNKHRIHSGLGCMSVWSPDTESLLLAGTLPGGTAEDDGRPRLLRLRPSSENSIADWDAEIVTGAEGLWDPEIIPLRPVVGGNGNVVFSAEDETGNRDIYLLPAGAGPPVRLTYHEGVDRWPTVAAGGASVFFVSDRTGNEDIWAIQLADPEPSQVTDHPLDDRDPWIQAGRLLFTRGAGEGDEDGNMELVLRDMVSGRERYLTDNTWNDYEANRSPDGRYICWQDEELGHYEGNIQVLDLETDRRWTAVNDAGRDGNCAFTPEGRGIVYHSWSSGDLEIYLVPLDGGEPMNLSRYPGHDGLVGVLPGR
jgi:Tol biopolymer transport system component/DNA-binding SARP family transcriptional activator